MPRPQNIKKKLLGPRKARFRGKINSPISQAAEQRRVIETSEMRLAQLYPKLKQMVRVASAGNLLDGDLARAQQLARRQTRLGQERQQAIHQLFETREKIKTESKKRKRITVGVTRRIIAGPRANLRLRRFKKSTHPKKK